MHVISAKQLEPAAGTIATSSEIARAAYRVRLTIAGVTMSLRTDNCALRDAIAQRFRDHASDRPAQFEYLVIDRNGHYLFTAAHARTWVWRHGSLSARALAFLTDAAAVSALVRYDRTLASFHAAAVRHGSIAAAIVGDSNAGKTTTLLACARSGMQFYSDERLLLRANRAQAFLRTCTIRSGGKWRLLRDDGGDALARRLMRGGSSQVDDVSLVEVFGCGAIAQPAALRAVFVLDGAAEVAAARVVPPTDALPAVARWADAGGHSLEIIARSLSMLRTARCFRLTMGTPRDTAACIARTLEEMAGSDGS
ncbi:MAG: hypothetical protein ACXVAR_05940 [Vulcanimicrobiaceae bacterium]